MRLPFSSLPSLILETAKVIPVHKKDSKVKVSDCRPISLLSNIENFFEKLTHSRLIEFLEERQSFATNILVLKKISQQIMPF